MANSLPEILQFNPVGSIMQGQQFAQAKQDAAQQNQLRALQLQQAQQGMRRDDQFRNELATYLQGGSDNLAALYQADPERAMQVQNFQYQQNQLARQKIIEDAKQTYAGAQYVMSSEAPKALAEVQFPQAVAALKEQGVKWDEWTDDDVRAFAEGIAARAGSQAGILPEYTSPESGQVDGEDVFFQADKTSGRPRVLQGVKPRPQRPLVQVDTGQKQETAEAQTVGKGFGEMYVDLQKAGVAADGKIARFDRMEQLIGKLETGKLTPAATEVAGWANAFGIDVDKNLGSKQAAIALSSEMALQLRNPSGGAGMPGAMSDKDREFLIQMSPGLSQTKEGRALIVETGKKIAQRDKDVAKIARDYRRSNGTLDEGFYDELAAFSVNNPLFEDVTVTTQDVPTAGVVEDGYKFKGGNPADPKSWEKVR